MPNFAVEKSVVVFVFALSSCRVQKYLVGTYYLVGQFNSKYFFLGFFCTVVGFSRNSVVDPLSVTCLLDFCFVEKWVISVGIFRFSLK